MKVIIAGGTGFVGRHVTAALRSAGHPVVVISRGTRRASPAEGVEHVRCDVAFDALPLERLAGCDAIVDLVGVKRERGALTFERGHLDATRHLIAAGGELGVRRFVAMSVVGIRPVPGSGYHITKWQAEEIVRSSGLKWTILRPGVIYGPGDPMVTPLVRWIRRMPGLPLAGRADAPMMPVSVDDVASAVLRALERGVSVGKQYDIVGPEQMTWREVILTVAQGIGRRVRLIRIPLPFQWLGAHLINAISPDPIFTPWQLQMLLDGLSGDPAPARADLGLNPAPLTAEAVRELAARM